MIEVICKACGHIWMAAVVMGGVKCPKCGATEDIYTAREVEKKAAE